MRGKILRGAAAAVFVAIAAAMPSAPAAAQDPVVPAPGITSVSAIVVTMEDGGRVLFGRASQEPRPVASLTKIVTALVVRDEYGLDDIVTVTNHVNTVRGSSLGLRSGMRLPVRDLLHALLLKSANDSATALAAHHPMGYEHFLRLMDAKARALGAYASSFRNPHGLDAPGHVSSAWDMAIFARQLLADPVLAQVVRTQRYGFDWPEGGTRYVTNHNKLLTRHEAIIGMKTGFTNQAGHSLIAAAQTPAGTLVSIVLNSQDHYTDSLALLAYGQQVEEAAASGGGGGGGSPLPAPPEPPRVVGFEVGTRPVRSDPRDDPRWAWMGATLAALTGASLVLKRRRDVVGRTADFHDWLETLTDPRTSRRRG